MKILFCGGGALGSHGLFLARDLEHDLAVIDFDRVETKNLASQWFVKSMVGKNKATALRMQLLNFYDVKLQDYTVKLTALNADAILGSADLVVECFDNAGNSGFKSHHTVRGSETGAQAQPKSGFGRSAHGNSPAAGGWFPASGFRISTADGRR